MLNFELCSKPIKILSDQPVEVEVLNYLYDGSRGNSARWSASALLLRHSSQKYEHCRRYSISKGVAKQRNVHQFTLSYVKLMVKCRWKKCTRLFFKSLFHFILKFFLQFRLTYTAVYCNQTALCRDLRFIKH